MWRHPSINRAMRKKLEAMLAGGGYSYSFEKQRIVPTYRVIELNSPWCFVGSSVNARNCFLWNTVMFKKFDLVPSFCRFRCHKIVAKPATVSQLIRAYHFMNALPYFTGSLSTPPGKAGIDRRRYTTNPYSMFWYANSLDHANTLYTIIKRVMLSQHLDDLASTLIIKRACTEMEATRGPTSGDFWQHMTPDEYFLEEQLQDIFLIEPESTSPLPAWRENATINVWLDFARQHGDLTGDALYGLPTMNPPVTYHDKEVKEDDSI